MDLLTAIHQAARIITVRAQVDNRSDPYEALVVTTLEWFLADLRQRRAKVYGRRVICGRCHRPLQFGYEVDGVAYGRVCWKKMTEE